MQSSREKDRTDGLVDGYDAGSASGDRLMALVAVLTLAAAMVIVGVAGVIGMLA